MNAGIIELYALPDAVGAATEDDDGRIVSTLYLIFNFIRRVVVGRAGRELPGAGIHGLVGRRDPQSLPDTPHDLRRSTGSRSESLVAEPDPLERSQLLG